MTKYSKEQIEAFNKARIEVGKPLYDERKEKDYIDYLKEARNKESDYIYKVKNNKKVSKKKFESFETLKEEELKENDE